MADATSLVQCLLIGEGKEYHTGSGQARFKHTFKEAEGLWILPRRQVKFSLNFLSLSFLTCKMGCCEDQRGDTLKAFHPVPGCTDQGHCLIRWLQECHMEGHRGWPLQIALPFWLGISEDSPVPYSQWGPGPSPRQMLWLLWLF